MKLICSKCNTVITRQIIELQDTDLLDDTEGKDYIPVGFYTVGNGILENEPDDKIIINLADLNNTRHHSNKSRLNGCCGLDGLDGINTVCINDHEIGTEYSDCWMAHYISLEPTSVKRLDE